MQNKISLASDNYAPTHPLVLQAITEANIGFAQSYGADPWTCKAQQLILKELKRNGLVYIVPTGTGANVLALKLCCRPHESIICSDTAHINYQESGAAEANIGCKLITVPHQLGKITVSRLLKALKQERMFGKHSTSPRVLSITQPTEFGTVYTIEELKQLHTVCRQENLLIHMDGCRLYQAAVHLSIPLSDIVQFVDILALGGTKNGLMSAESVVIFNSELELGSDYLQKQTLQLLSKMRYLSAQYIPFFEKNLWKDLATHSNLIAQEMAQIIQSNPNLKLSYPVQTNQLFFQAPPSFVPIIQEKIQCYLWREDVSEIRLVTSWNSTQEDVDEFRAIVGKLML